MDGNRDELPPPEAGRARHALGAEEELRLEVAFQRHATLRVVLQRGSCELCGVELALQKEYTFVDGGLKLAFFTWYGCVLDVECEARNLEICYKAEATETACNVAYVNTHAQLEALRDEAAATGGPGPRVLVVGPRESGKSTCARLLTAYACKLGRAPVLVDLDPGAVGSGAAGVPGTLAACPMGRDAITVTGFAAGAGGGLPPGAASPLLLWHGSATPSAATAELFAAQVRALGTKVDRRLAGDDWERASGIIVDTSAWLQEEGYPQLLEAMAALRISVVLVMGHDRLYAQLRTHTETERDTDSNGGGRLTVIKLPRSGGLVARNAVFMRQARSRAMRRYFYGDMVELPAAQQQLLLQAQSHPKNGTKPNARVPQLTPFLLHLPFDKVRIYKFASLSLAASLLPVAAAQTTEPVQLAPVEVSEQLQLALLAVCHPQAVAAYEASGRASDLYEAGVAGFCVVEKVLMESGTLHLLSPCAGALPSHVLLMGDIIWMD